MILITTLLMVALIAAISTASLMRQQAVLRHTASAQHLVQWHLLTDLAQAWAVFIIKNRNAQKNWPALLDYTEKNKLQLHATLELKKSFVRALPTHILTPSDDDFVLTITIKNPPYHFKIHRLMRCISQNNQLLLLTLWENDETI